MGLFSKLFAKNQKSEVLSASYLNPHSSLGELDLYLIGEGRHEQLWKALGAQVSVMRLVHYWVLLFQYGHLMRELFH